MRLIHYSKEIINSLDNREYDQNDVRHHCKPNGFWVSVLGKYDWKYWVEQENFRPENLAYSYEVTLNPDYKILYIKTSEELYYFTKKYPLKRRTYDIESDTYQVNWFQVKKEYSGIIISPYQWDCRLALESSWYYGWDCSSGCLWDLKCIKDFIPLNSIANILDDDKSRIIT